MAKSPRRPKPPALKRTDTQLTLPATGGQGVAVDFASLREAVQSLYGKTAAGKAVMADIDALETKTDVSMDDVNDNEAITRARSFEAFLKNRTKNFAASLSKK